MLKFAVGCMATTLLELYVFQTVGMMEVGVHLTCLGMLFLTFNLVKNDKIKEIIVSNVCMMTVLLVLRFSEKTFRYIPNTSKLLIFIGVIVIAELFGGFWGRKFTRDRF
ncbi:hypothetical protein RyT2_27650 [Pseudolactococcus yaeyamensis]